MTNLYQVSGSCEAEKVKGIVCLHKRKKGKGKRVLVLLHPQSWELKTENQCCLQRESARRATGDDRDSVAIDYQATSLSRGFKMSLYNSPWRPTSSYLTTNSYRVGRRRRKWCVVVINGGEGFSFTTSPTPITTTHHHTINHIR